MPTRLEAAEKASMLSHELAKIYPGRVHVSELLKSTFQVQVNFPFDSNKKPEAPDAQKAVCNTADES